MREAARRIGGDAIRLASLEAFVEACHDAYFSEDVDGRIVAWNRSADRLFGHHAVDILGEPALGLFPVGVRPLIERLFHTARGGDNVDHVETEIERSGGMPVPISLSLCLVGDADSDDRNVVAVVRDLTEQRLAQAALAETEARLREAEALAHAGRWLWDVASDTVQWSEEMHRIHGVDPASFEGSLDGHLAIVHADDAAGVRAALATSVAAGRPLDVEYRIVRSDESVRWLYARGEVTFGSAGTVVGLHGFAQDVTDRSDFGDPTLATDR